MTIDVHHGDSRDVLKTLAENSIDSCVTDPPYALVSIGKRFGSETAAAPKGDLYKRAVGGFMGERWDTGEVAFDPTFWREVYRVLKPGAWLLAFGATRTYHELGTAIAEAGFEVRDSILDVVASDSALETFLASLDAEQGRAFARALEESRFGGLAAWVYGAGFPKNTDFAAVPGSKRDGGRTVRPELEGTPFAEGWGTALKPAFEPVVMAQKPFPGPIHANVKAWGTGGLNIDASRVPMSEADREAINAMGGFGKPGWEGNARAALGDSLNRKVERASAHAAGRWPANVITDGSPEVMEAFPVTAPAGGPVKGSEPSGSDFGAGGFRRAAHDRGRRPGGFGDVGASKGDPRPNGPTYADGGSAARFFWSGKADAEDRLGSKHPTVKPVAPIRHFVEMVTPPGGTVLDPFAGSGTTGIAAMGAGLNAVLIEREAKYVADIERRIAWATGGGRLSALEMARELDTPEGQAKASGLDTPLFGEGV